MKKGKIILLNGSSSAGKTTLALALQTLLKEPWQHIALDQFRDGLPMRYRGLNSPPGTPGQQGLNVVPIDLNGERVTSIQFGEHGDQVLSGMRRAIAAFAAVGNNAIVDDLLFKPEYLHDYADILCGFDTWLVGVRCSLEVVNQRETQRIGRFPGTATSHFHSIHAHVGAYDIEVNTTERSAEDCALEIVRRMDTAPFALEAVRERPSTIGVSE